MEKEYEGVPGNHSSAYYSVVDTENTLSSMRCRELLALLTSFARYSKRVQAYGRELFERLVRLEEDNAAGGAAPSVGASPGESLSGRCFRPQ